MNTRQNAALLGISVLLASQISATREDFLASVAAALRGRFRREAPVWNREGRDRRSRTRDFKERRPWRAAALWLPLCAQEPESTVWPTPRKASYGDAVKIDGWKYEAPERLRAAAGEALGPSREDGHPLALRRAEGVQGPQGYALIVTDRDASITAETEVGLYYGLLSLRQLCSAGAVRRCEIEDRLAFETRGIIVSSDEVVRVLARYKFNLLQYPGGRGALDDARKARYRRMVETCELGFVRFLSHEGYQGKFWGEPLPFTDEGIAKLVDYFNLRYDLGAREFVVAFDDLEMHEKGTGSAWGANHARACRAVYDALKKRDKDVLLFFCPVPYGGTPGHGFVLSDKQEAMDYLEQVRRILPEDVRVFWTGTGVFSEEMKPSHLLSYGKLIGRKPFLWDNDAISCVNGFNGLRGRAKELHEEASGYVANIHEGETKRALDALPTLLTIADYLWNPEAYDEKTALDRAFRWLAGDRAKDLAEAWNAVREKRRPAPEKVDAWLAALKGLRDPVFEEKFRKLVAAMK